MKILFIEDQPDTIADTRKRLENLCDVSCMSCDFDKSEEKLRSEQPDIAVVDLFQGGMGAQGENLGRSVCESIWEHRFCPIIIYSADPDSLDNEEYRKHPLVKLVKKGRRSPDEIAKIVDEFESYVVALDEVRQDFVKQTALAMRETAEYAVERDDPASCLKRAARRRVAARMDHEDSSDERLAGWEQYLFPPVSKNVALGDILFDTNGDKDEPSAYSVVLTPSCDLVRTGGRDPKVSNVLVARSCSVPDMLKDIGLEGVKPNKLEKRLPGVLSQGFQGSVIPLPKLEGKLPAMAAATRELELIPLDKIAEDDQEACGKTYIRVASIDSPFRELVSWAYLNTAGRPGLPDRDLDAWTQDVIASMNHLED